MTGNTLEQRAAGILSQALADLGYKPSLAFGGMIPAEAARAAVEAAMRLSAGADWQPIETAPRDGTVVMIHERWEDVPIFASWHKGKWYADTSSYDGDAGVYDKICQQNVTHWQPLPAAPRHEPGEG